MPLRGIHFATSALALIVASASTPIFACATCGCTLSTGGANGYAGDGGWHLNLQYDFIDQSQLRKGSDSISSPRVATINDAGGDQEVERGTINRYLTLGLSYAANTSWSFNLQVPYIVRSHSTYGSGTNPLTPDQISSAHLSGIGDIKFISNFQGILPTHNLGVQLGVKLPTGNYGGPNNDGTGIVGNNPARFDGGPAAQEVSPGNLLDTSLQLGTGSTDLILGAYYYQAVSQNFDAFIDGQFQSAVVEKLDHNGENFRPGNQANLSLGLRYEADSNVTPQVQLNLNRRSHDQGALADTENSAGTVAYLSPGVSTHLGKNLHVYGFMQVPIYSHLDGYQLFPRWTATIGLSTAL